MTHIIPAQSKGAPKGTCVVNLRNFVWGIVARGLEILLPGAFAAVYGGCTSLGALLGHDSRPEADEGTFWRMAGAEASIVRAHA